MLAVLLNNKANTSADWFYLGLGIIAIAYLVYRKAKNWSDTNPDAWARLLDKWGFHEQAKVIWDKLASPQTEKSTKPEHFSLVAR
jgi:hypothetical protein